MIAKSYFPKTIIKLKCFYKYVIRKSYLQFELWKSRSLTVLTEHICLSIREPLYRLIKQLANSGPQEGLLRGPMAVTVLKLAIYAKK